MNRLSHGMSKTRFYRIYCHIWNRCNRVKNDNYSRYGGKGIKNEWKNFEEFYNDMYTEYLNLSGIIGEEKVSIERLDNSKNYCKENCKWIDLMYQQENRDTNHYITYNGETHNLRKWAKILRVSESLLRARIVVHRWSIEKAFSTKKRESNIYMYLGETGTLGELACKLGVNKKQVHRKAEIIKMGNKNY